jgi:hypothetical protein
MSAVIKELIAKTVIRASPRPANLYQIASMLPRDGVGAKVVPAEWATRDDPELFFTLTHVRLTPGMTQGVISGIKTTSGLISGLQRD